MTLNEFKIIYYWEYAHRLLARIIGIVAIIPLLVITYKYKKSVNYNKKYYSIFALICLQGLIGWLMVSSGLIDNIDVSHYRLALHLSLALIILSLIFWFMLNNSKTEKFNDKLDNNFLNLFFLLIIIQIILGALLAGLNGGLIYNSWPDMNGNFIPSDISGNDLYSIKSTNNPSIIQFYHRITAYLIFIFLIFLNYLYIKKKLNIKTLVIFNSAILLQIVLGIYTLVTGVKIEYASLHQLGSVFVLISFINIYYKNIN